MYIVNDLVFFTVQNNKHCLESLLKKGEHDQVNITSYFNHSRTVSTNAEAFLRGL